MALSGTWSGVEALRDRDTEQYESYTTWAGTTDLPPTALALSALWIGPFVSGVKIALARLGDRAHRSRTRIRVTSNGKYSCVRIWHGFTFQRLDPARAAHLLDTRHHGALSPRAARHHHLLSAAFSAIGMPGPSKHSSAGQNKSPSIPPRTSLMELARSAPTTQTISVAQGMQTARALTANFRARVLAQAGADHMSHTRELFTCSYGPG